MKKKTIAVLVMIFSLVAIQTQAQVNYPSGYYNADSLFFTVNWNVEDNQQLQWSINRFTEESWQPYVHGVWLKPRPDSINTWENNIYTGGFNGGDCYYSVDPNQLSGPRKKINIIRVRLLETLTHTVVKDSVYFIGFGEFHPYWTFYITVDSIEFAEMFKNYEQDIRIRAQLQIFTPYGINEINQPVEFYISGTSSTCIANKGLIVKAENDAPIFGKKAINTSIFSKNSERIEEKRIKLRSGNGGQIFSFGINEVAEKILDYQSLGIGGVEVNIGIIYINGSYWSLTFPQRKSDDERDIARNFNINKDSVNVYKPSVYFTYIDSGIIQCNIENNDTLCGFRFCINNTYDSSANYAALNNLPNECYFFQGDTSIYPQKIIDSLSSNIVMIKNIENLYKIIADIESGNKYLFDPIAKELDDLMTLDPLSNHYNSFLRLIDIDNWLRYLIYTHYFGNYDAVFNNLVLAMSYKDKVRIIGNDFDNIHFNDIYSNNWDTRIFNEPRSYYNEGFVYRMNRMMNHSQEIKERLIQLYQGMVNTMFLPNRTIALFDSFKNSFLSEYTYHYNAWGGWPNGGQSYEDEINMLDRFKYFLENRNNQALQYVTDYFQPSDSLNISTDLHTISLIFDSIDVQSAKIVINRDTLTQFTSNWSGKYFKKPSVLIDIENYGNTGLYVKEYPDSGLHFEIYPDSNITITLLHGQATATTNHSVQKEETFFYPNPVNSAVYFLKDGIITITNIVGEVVYYGKDKNINISHLPSGSYFISLENNNQIQTQKFIKL